VILIVCGNGQCVHAATLTHSGGASQGDNAVRTKSGGNGAVSSEVVLSGVIVYTRGVESSGLKKDIEQAFIEIPVFPAGQREDLRGIVWRGKPFFGPRPIERRKRGPAMKIQRGFGPCLTIGEPGELLAVAKEKLDMEARPVNLHHLVPSRARSGEAKTRK
jgi:hypothetical protein